MTDKDWAQGKEYVDWQKILSDEFDVDGYTLSQASAKDFYMKFRKAKADGMRESAALVENGRFLHDDSPPKRFANEVVPMLRAAASKLDPPAS